MFNWLLGRFNKGHIGIDLGISAIKIVELGKKDGRLNLVNYVLTQSRSVDGLKISDLKDEEVAKILVDLIAKADINGRVANVSLPINQTFSTIIDFPEMPEEELAAAIPFEAKKYVPVPLEEVVLDWSIVGRTASGSAKNNVPATDIKNPANSSSFSQSPQLQVLLVAVPKEIINRMSKIAKLANLTIATLEQEAFSLARSFVGQDKSTFLIIDIGRKSSDLVVVDDGSVRLSHNLETIDKEILLAEIERLVNVFRTKYNKNIGTCLLTGGRSFDKEIFNYLSEKLSVPVVVGNPFAKLEHSPVLEPALKELGPQLSVAVGLAMRE